MKGIISSSLEIYLLGLIAFLLVVIMFMLGKVTKLLATSQERQNLMVAPEMVGYDRSVSTGCTEEELAAITAVLAKLLPEQKLNIVNVKLI